MELAGHRGSLYGWPFSVLLFAVAKDVVKLPRQ